MENKPDKQVLPEKKVTDSSKRETKLPVGTTEDKAREGEEKFPGYPHYPQQDDLLVSGNNTGRIDADVDEISGENGSAQGEK